MRWKLPTLILIVLAAIAVVAWFAIPGLGGRDMATGPGGLPPDHELADAVGGQFNLVDQDDKPVNEKSWPGKYLLVFFGFTYCPDVCPTTLAELASVMKDLGPAADRIQPLFVTVDPERDNPAAMKSYTSTFDPRFVGLTGSRQAIDAMLKTYRVYATRRGEGEDYTMDHSALIYLMGPDGRLKAVLTPDMDQATMVQSLSKLVGTQP